MLPFRHEFLPRRDMETMLNGDVETGRQYCATTSTPTVGFVRTGRGHASLTQKVNAGCWGRKVAIPRCAKSFAHRFPICSITKGFNSGCAPPQDRKGLGEQAGLNRVNLERMPRHQCFAESYRSRPKRSSNSGRE